MAWKKYRSLKSGQCHVDMKGEGEVFAFQMGLIETGQCRVFAGYYIKVTDEDGEEWTGEDGASVLGALRALDDDIGQSGGRLLCAGLRDDFYESGLSANSGFGYLKGSATPIHVMARGPLPPINEGGASPSMVSQILERLRNRPIDE